MFPAAPGIDQVRPGIHAGRGVAWGSSVALARLLLGKNPGNVI